MILPSFYPVSVFQWCAAELLLEIFTEERCVGEAQRIGNLINGQIRVGKIITDILHNIFRYPLQGRFAADFLADGGEVLRFDTDIKSSVAGQLNPLFKNFKQSEKMNINCEIDKVENGAPLAFDKSWNFEYQAGSPALSGGVTDFARLFPEGLPFFGMKKVNFLDKNNDQNYYFAAPLPSARFGLSSSYFLSPSFQY